MNVQVPSAERLSILWELRHQLRQTLLGPRALGRMRRKDIQFDDCRLLLGQKSLMS